jgi:hypothetical protein
MMRIMLGLAVMLGMLSVGGTDVWAQAKAEKTFAAVLTDAQGIETEVRNVVYYWEEKISETSFIPHELRHMPVKRGAATVSVKFDTIKQIEVKAGADKAHPALTITLTNGKTGEFTPAINGSFRGESDFGQVDVPLGTVAKVVLK